MGNRREFKTLRELGVTLIDCVHKTPKAVEQGIPYIGIPQMKTGVVDFDAAPRLISEEDFITWTQKANPTYGDVILSRRCNPGETAYVPKGRQFALGQNLVLLRPDSEKMYPGYLRWVVKSPFWWDEVERYRNPGAVFDSLKCADIPEFKIPAPSYEEQKQIDGILRSIGEKLELSEKINQTLEQMAQTLFKSWFVDFDPVIDNALDAISSGKKVDIPEVFETRVERRKAVRESADFKPLPDDVRQLFPSEFEESELGWVPKGWGSETFNDIFDIASSKRVFAKDYVDSGVPFYRGKEITELSQGKAVNTEIFISEEKYQELKDKSGAPKAGDILITSVGTIGNTYLVREGDKFYFKDGNLTWIRGYKKERIPFFIKEWFKTSQAKDAIERVKIGTTQQAITIKALNKIVVLLPSTKILSFYENYLSNTYSKHSANLDENAYLEKLRDTLLPKLISGELRLDSPEVEQAKALVE